MKTSIVIANLIAAAFSLTAPPITGKTPPAIDCPNTLCTNKADGNYEMDYAQNYFVQCLVGLSYCQACFPMNLVFSHRCNQCLYNKNDDCYTTAKWEPATTFKCPDMCPSMGYDYNGNMADPSERRQYVACWEGVTVGCMACPYGLEFNEKENACLYEGKYITKPAYNDSDY